MKRQRVYRLLDEIDACFAVTHRKHICARYNCCQYPGGSFRKPAYHIHPDRDWPEETAILRFESLDKIGRWAMAVKKARGAGDPAVAEFMADFWASEEG